MENILLGIISSILATFITNAIHQYKYEKKIIGDIERNITDYIKYTNKFSIVDQQLQFSYEMFFSKINGLLVSLFIFKNKSDKAMSELSSIRKTIYSKGTTINIFYIKSRLERIRDDIL